MTFSDPYFLLVVPALLLFNSQVKLVGVLAMYPAAQSQVVGAVFVGSHKELAAKDIDLSDFELEQWFLRYKSELVGLTSLDLGPLAPWLHAIGPPAKDNIGRQDQSAKARFEPI